MKSLIITCLVLVTLASVIFAEPDLKTNVNGGAVYKFSHSDPNDEGQLINCGKSKGGSDFTLTWSPAKITAGKTYTINVKGTASTDFASGTFNATVWIDGVPNPFMKKVQQVKCDEAIPYVKKLFKCPIKKGASLSLTNYQMVAPKKTSQVPPGSYTVEVRLTNSRNELFVCAKGDLTFT